jgi:hypothetical protein
MTNKNLNIGLYEIMPNNIKANSLEELKNEVGKLGNGWEISKWNVANYISTMCKYLGICDYMKSYECGLTISISCVITDDNGYSRYVMTDEPEEIKNYMEGEEAIMYDNDGGDYNISRSMVDHDDIFYESFYICRPK